MRGAVTAISPLSSRGRHHAHIKLYGSIAFRIPRNALSGRPTFSSLLFFIPLSPAELHSHRVGRCEPVRRRSRSNQIGYVDFRWIRSGRYVKFAETFRMIPAIFDNENPLRYSRHKECGHISGQVRERRYDTSAYIKISNGCAVRILTFLVNCRKFRPQVKALDCIDFIWTNIIIYHNLINWKYIWKLKETPIDNSQ